MNCGKVKILVLTTSTKISGAERSLVDVLMVFPDSVLPLVVVPDKGELYQLLQSRVDIVNVGLIRFKKRTKVFTLIKQILRVIKHTYQLTRIIRSRKIDLIYTNTLSSQIYAILLKVITGKKIIWHVRDNLTNKFFSFLFSYFSDKILCTSKHIFEQVPFKTRAHLVYNGIDTQLWKSDHSFFNRVKDELDVEKNTILVGHVGQIIPWKRHDLFIKVAIHTIHEHDINVHFVILGDDLFDDFPGHQLSLRQMVDSSNLSDRISFLNHKSNLMEYLNGIDIVLHMSDNEPFGRVVIEAMALEKPVIARNHGGPKEIISDNRSGFLLHSSDPAVIAQKLRMLINDERLRKEFGREGRKIVETNFSINNLTKIGSIISMMK